MASLGYKKKNHGLRVTILGSGTCVPSLKRSACAVLMQTGVSNLLFDCGPGTMRRLLETGVEIFDISHVFISHFHPDHTGELVAFLFANKYANGHKRRNPLTLVGAEGFSRFFSGLQGVFGRWIDLGPEMLDIIELSREKADEVSFAGFQIKSIPMTHSPESIAYRVTGPDGTSVVYSGDTDFNENLIALSKAAQVLICESAFPDAHKKEGHMTPSLAGEIARQAQVGRLVLTHLYPECEDVDIKKQCRKTYAGPLTVAEDLMQVSI